MSKETTYGMNHRDDHIDLVDQYLQHGFALTPLRPHTKVPLLPNWSDRQNAITTSADLDKSVTSAGLLLAYCSPPLMTLDIDDFEPASAWLDQRGVDISRLLIDSNSVQIVSGVSNHAKLLYRLDRPRPTHQVQSNGRVILEFRCSTRDNGSVQDVVPPSIHPKTGTPYRWSGDWRAIPTVPETLINLWDELTRNGPGQPNSVPICSNPACTAAGLRETLRYLDPNPEPQWWRVIAAAASTGTPEAKNIAREWSRGSPKHTDAKFEKKWNNALARVEREPRIGFGTLKRMAREAEEEHSSLISHDANRSLFKVRSMDKVSITPIHWLWPDMLAKAKVHLMAGAGGRGKTTLLLAVAAKITRGEPLPGGDASTPKSVLYVSGEDGAADVLKPRFVAAGGDPTLLHELPSLTTANGQYLSIIEHGQDIEQIVRETQAAFTIIDPVTAFCGSHSDNNNATHIRAVMARLQEIAESTGTALMALNHLTKSTEASMVNRVLGSGAWTHASRIVWGVIEDQTLGHLMGLMKSNIGPIDHVYPYFLKPGEVEDVEVHYATIGARILGERLTNYVDFDEPRHGKKTTEAETYLWETLQDGPKRKKDIINETKFNDRTLQRAADKLGVKKERENAAHGPAIWELPVEAA